VTTIFAKIVAGEIPAIKVYENTQTLAFLDIGPATRGHTLVICKAAFPDLYSIPPETLAAVHTTVQRVAQALRAALAPDGLNVLQNNGAAAGQSVFHYHVHLIPRWAGDGALPLWEPRQADPQALEQLAAQIRGALE
jgi:histidine triad (HIT) family protein